MKIWLTAILISLWLWPAQSSWAGSLQDKLTLIHLPRGFTISVYAEGLDNARQLALGDEGTVFAGSAAAGKVYAVLDTDNDHVADRQFLIARGLTAPTGLEFKFGSLYVAALNQILRYDDIESSLEQPPKPEMVTSILPKKTHHGRRYLRFGPDGDLFVGIGAPCNVCVEPGFGEIWRMDADGSGTVVYAKGVRNSVGMAFNPTTGELWFTDNGRDLLGDDIPSDELNRVAVPGSDFGFPYCHQGNLLDPEFGQGKSCADYTPPAALLGAHVAALGFVFNSITDVPGSFPTSFLGAAFIARHGSWNRTQKTGYDIAMVRFDAAGNALKPEVFATGWLQGEKEWGRPNDVLQMPDGSLLVSDDLANAIYRISYNGQ